MNDPVFIFTLIAACFVLFGMSVMVIGTIHGHRRLGKLPRSKADIQYLSETAHSPWDPFSQTGAKRWRRILFALFWVIAAAGFVLVKRHNERLEIESPAAEAR